MPSSMQSPSTCSKGTKSWHCCLFLPAGNCAGTEQRQSEGISASCLVPITIASPLPSESLTSTHTALLPLHAHGSTPSTPAQLSSRSRWNFLVYSQYWQLLMHEEVPKKESAGVPLLCVAVSLWVLSCTQAERQIDTYMPREVHPSTLKVT